MSANARNLILHARSISTALLGRWRVAPAGMRKQTPALLEGRLDCLSAMPALKRLPSLLGGAVCGGATLLGAASSRRQNWGGRRYRTTFDVTFGRGDIGAITFGKGDIGARQSKEAEGSRILSLHSHPDCVKRDRKP